MRCGGRCPTSLFVKGGCNRSKPRERPVGVNSRRFGVEMTAQRLLATCISRRADLPDWSGSLTFSNISRSALLDIFVLAGNANKSKDVTSQVSWLLGPLDVICFTDSGCTAHRKESQVFRCHTTGLIRSLRVILGDNTTTETKTDHGGTTKQATTSRAWRALMVWTTTTGMYILVNNG